MSRDLFQTSLLETAPSSISSDPQVVAMCKALDAEFLAVSKAIREVITIADVDSISDERLLDILAHQLHVDFWQDVLTGGPLTTEKKKQLIKNSLDWHSRLGTPSVVEDVVRTFFSDATISEWYEYNPAPAPRARRYRFRVATEQGITDPAVYARLVEAINSVKNARSWLESIDQMVTVKGSVYVGVFQYLTIHFTVPAHG